MVQRITAPVSQPRPDLTAVAIRVERLRLVKRRWRGRADDGAEFAFELEVPLRHEQVVWETETLAYRIEQQEEPLLEVSLDLPPSAAAGVGWAVGNLHLELMSEPHRLLTPDEPAARQLLDRLKLVYTPVRARFRAGRFARGTSATHDLGPSHRH